MPRQVTELVRKELECQIWVRRENKMYLTSDQDIHRFLQSGPTRDYVKALSLHEMSLVASEIGTEMITEHTKTVLVEGIMEAVCRETLEGEEEELQSESLGGEIEERNVAAPQSGVQVQLEIARLKNA